MRPMLPKVVHANVGAVMPDLVEFNPQPLARARIELVPAAVDAQGPRIEESICDARR